ncbi:MAG: hypothetical protein E7163_04070 [Firmicutes bacterium]|nr:hypothetical protein [Bacillota bacterium]
MELIEFNSFDELVTTKPENEEAKLLRYELLEKIYKTSYKNAKWIGLIIDFLNANDEGKYYSEYYLTPDFSYGTRKYTYRFISTEEDKPYSITDDDIQVLKRLNAQPKFILYDYQEKPNSDVFAYLQNEKTLIDVIQAIGMPNELKSYLCDYCFNRLSHEHSMLVVQEQSDPALLRQK